jgi:hypothetical protein
MISAFPLRAEAERGPETLDAAEVWDSILLRTIYAIALAAALFAVLTFVACMGGANHQVPAVERCAVQTERLLSLVLGSERYKAHTLRRTIRVAKHFETFYLADVLEEALDLLLGHVTDVRNKDLLWVRLPWGHRVAGALVAALALALPLALWSVKATAKVKIHAVACPEEVEVVKATPAAEVSKATSLVGAATSEATEIDQIVEGAAC